jgi:hypothetical protein
LHFGNADGYYRSGCRDIKAAAPGLATGSLRISEMKGQKDFDGSWRPDRILPTKRS